MLAANFKVRVLVRPGSANAHRIDPRCDAVSIGLADHGHLAQVCGDATAIVYCAGSVRGARLADFLEANVHGVERMLQAASSQPQPPAFLLLSSLAASRPELSWYAQSKHQGERTLERFPRLPWTILRPPAIYGPGDRELLPLLRAIRRGLAPLVGPVTQRLSLLHVSDLADAVLAWLGHCDACRSQTFAIDDGTPAGYDWPAIIGAVTSRAATTIRVPPGLLHLAAAANLAGARIFRYRPMLTPGKVRELCQPSWLCDNASFSAITGWSATIDLRSGARQLFEPGPGDHRTHVGTHSD
ncbi:MAG: NAD(P)-dependent oxidoreductase [Gammaproteobacteria bacterium]|nr:NAD(P)-dependent oxidoreductase [Gammaproteobacteria bacterium]